MTVDIVKKKKNKKKKNKKKPKFLFSGKNKKNISKCCMLNFVSADNLTIFVFFPRKQILTFHANCLQMSNVYWKKNKLSPICFLLKMSRVLTISFQQMTFLNSFLIFSQVTGFDISCTLFQLETECMECQILLAGKTKKVSSNILSADIIQRVVKVRNLLLHWATFYLKMTFFVE